MKLRIRVGEIEIETEGRVKQIKHVMNKVIPEIGKLFKQEARE